VFNIGPLEMVVIAVVGLIVLGPDKLPSLARDAARMIRTLRDLATGARTQLRDELGPEFADLDLGTLRNLNPRTALQRAILGDEDLTQYDPRTALRKAFADDEPVARTAEPDQPVHPVQLDKPAPPPAQQPLGRGEQAPFDADAT